MNVLACQIHGTFDDWTSQLCDGLIGSYHGDNRWEFEIVDELASSHSSERRPEGEGGRVPREAQKPLFDVELYSCNHHPRTP